MPVSYQYIKKNTKNEAINLSIIQNEMHEFMSTTPDPDKWSLQDHISFMGVIALHTWGGFEIEQHHIDKILEVTKHEGRFAELIQEFLLNRYTFRGWR
jgi:hypothetical protein